MIFPSPNKDPKVDPNQVTCNKKDKRYGIHRSCQDIKNRTSHCVSQYEFLDSPRYYRYNCVGVYVLNGGGQYLK